jgi:cobalt-zinc-cadmium efflux system outer membrane protein
MFFERRHEHGACTSALDFPQRLMLQRHIDVARRRQVPTLVVIVGFALIGVVMGWLLPEREARAEGGSLTMEQAVAIALERNRDAIAARLEMRAAELDKVAAGLYPNPVLSYSIGNLPIGSGSPYNVTSGAPASPGFFSQPVHNVALAEIIDVWSKRGARLRAADRGLEHRRFAVEDALREIAYAVRSAFADVVREQSERQLSYDIRDRYAETVRLSRTRFSAGEISESEFRKIELEGLKYQTAVIAADTEYDLARTKLAALLALPSVADLPQPLVDEVPSEPALPEAALVARALERRPDVRAAERARALAEANLGAARREALPDLTLSASYTHSEFTVSGDNPNTLGFGLALPLPLFDRNQANIGRAELDIRRAANETARLEIVVRSEVGEAARKFERAKLLLGVFEQGGMLDRADNALRVAEKSYKAGAISLIELLEAQRTYLETRAEYLRAQYDQRQSRIDLRRVVGSDLK